MNNEHNKTGRSDLPVLVNYDFVVLRMRELFDEDFPSAAYQHCDNACEGCTAKSEPEHQLVAVASLGLFGRGVLVGELLSAAVSSGHRQRSVAVVFDLNGQSLGVRIVGDRSVASFDLIDRVGEGLACISLCVVQSHEGDLAVCSVDLRIKDVAFAVGQSECEFTGLQVTSGQYLGNFRSELVLCSVGVLELSLSAIGYRCCQLAVSIIVDFHSDIYGLCVIGHAAGASDGLSDGVGVGSGFLIGDCGELYRSVCSVLDVLYQIAFSVEQ